MTKIQFGYNNDIEARGPQEGIGIKPGLLLCEADYYGAVEYDGKEYIIAKVTSDEFNNYPQFLDRFIVADSIYDLYADGSGILMIDQEKSMYAESLENYLNSSQLKDRIHNINDVLNNCTYLHMAPIKYRLLELGTSDMVPIISTSIIHEAFLNKQQAIMQCHSSISNMQSQLSQGYNR